MDVEQKVAFILDLQARTQANLNEIAELQRKAEVRANRADTRMDRADARMDRADARMDRFERSLEGMRKLIRVGMKMIADNQRAIKELTVAQRETERQLKSFLASMEKGGNGHRRN